MLLTCSLSYILLVLQCSASTNISQQFITQAHISGRDWKYFVGQIPLAGNAPAIWQLIWENNIKIIAVLERDSSALFYPENGTSIPLNDVRVLSFTA